MKYPCLVLDHDDTVVQSEATINYPFFCDFLASIRPGSTISLKEYVQGCSDLGFVKLCRSRFQFTDQELETEYCSWKEYIRNHIPAPYSGIDHVIQMQKNAGGLICVVSMSSSENIERDYQTHFGIKPDEIYGWDLAEEHRKPSPYALNKIMEKYHLRPDQILVIDDMKPAWEMARSAGVAIGFAGWGRLEYPDIMTEMTALCDHTFCSTEELYDFLFK